MPSGSSAWPRFQRVHAAASAAVAAALGAVLAFGFPVTASADELSDVRAELQVRLDEAQQLADDVKSAQDRIAELDGEIAGILDDIDRKQAEYAQLQRHAADVARAMYKNHGDLNVLFIFDEAETLSEAMSRMEMRDRVIAEYGSTMEAARAVQAALQADYEQVSEDKDSQTILLHQMQEDQVKLDETIRELKQRETELDLAQQAALAQAAAAAHRVAGTFETGTVAGEDAPGWRTGIASAYGGSSDPSTPNPGTTATGTVCDDWSVGVAVPLAWGPSAYYGRRVEISYDGRSIIAPVVDCGTMGNGARALDLQPGVFKAFGCSTCDEWGIREVSYRFV